MEHIYSDKKLSVFPEEKIDSGNSAKVFGEIKELIGRYDIEKLIIYVSKLRYISSSGLREIASLSRDKSFSLTVSGASPEIYEIFDVTGFTDLLDIRRKKRDISVSEDMLIGTGTTAKVYRIDKEHIVKVFNSGFNEELSEAQKHNAQQLVIRGIPSAVAYDTVQVGDNVGVVYEMLEGETLGKAVSREPDRIREYAEKMAALLRSIHRTKFDKSLLIDTLRLNEGNYDMEAVKKYASRAMKNMSTLDNGNTLVHSDYHPGNIMIQNGEIILIDTGDAYFRHGILDLVTVYTYLVLHTRDDEESLAWNGMKPETAHKLWELFRDFYFLPKDDDERKSIDDVIKMVLNQKMAMVFAFMDGFDDDTRREYISQCMIGVPEDEQGFLRLVNEFEAKYGM